MLPHQYTNYLLINTPIKDTNYIFQQDPSLSPQNLVQNKKLTHISNASPNLDLDNIIQVQQQFIHYTQNVKITTVSQYQDLEVVIKYDDDLINHYHNVKVRTIQDERLQQVTQHNQYSEKQYQTKDKNKKNYQILQQEQSELFALNLANPKQILKQIKTDKTIPNISSQNQKYSIDVTAKKLTTRISHKGKKISKQNCIQIQRQVLQKILNENEKLKQSISQLIIITKRLRKNEQILKQCRQINKQKISKLKQSNCKNQTQIKSKSNQIKSLNQIIQKLNKQIIKLTFPSQVKQKDEAKYVEQIALLKNENLKLQKQLQQLQIKSKYVGEVNQNDNGYNNSKLNGNAQLNQNWQQSRKNKLDTPQKQAQQLIQRINQIKEQKNHIITHNIQELTQQDQFKCNHCNQFLKQFYQIKTQLNSNIQKHTNLHLQIDRLKKVQKQHLGLITTYINKIYKFQKQSSLNQQNIHSLQTLNRQFSQKIQTLDQGEYNLKLQKKIDQLKEDNNILTRNYLNLQEECQNLYKIRQSLQQKIKIAQEIENQLQHYKTKQKKDQKQIIELQNQLTKQKKLRNDNQNALREQYHLLYEEHKEVLEEYEKQCQKVVNLQAAQFNYLQLKKKYDSLQSKNQQLQSINETVNLQFKTTLNKLVNLQDQIKKYQKQKKVKTISSQQRRVSMKQFQFLQNQDFFQFDLLNNQTIPSSMLVPLYNKIEIIMQENQSIKNELHEANARISQLQQVNHELSQQLSSTNISLSQSQIKIKLLSDQIQAKQHQIQVVMMSKRTIQSNQESEYNQSDSKRRVSLNQDISNHNQRRYTLKFQYSNENSRKDKLSSNSQMNSQQSGKKQQHDKSVQLSQQSCQTIKMTKVQSQQNQQQNPISQQNLLQSQKIIVQGSSQQKQNKIQSSLSSESIKISKYQMRSQIESFQKSQQTLQFQIKRLNTKIQQLSKELLKQQNDRQQIIQSTHRVWQEKELLQKQIQKQSETINRQNQIIAVNLQGAQKYKNDYSNLKEHFMEFTNKISMINNQSFKSLNSLKSIPQEPNNQDHLIQIQVQQQQTLEVFQNTKNNYQPPLKQTFLLEKVDSSQLLLNLVSNLIVNTVLQICLQDVAIEQEKEQYHYRYVKYMQQSFNLNKNSNIYSPQHNAVQGDLSFYIQKSSQLQVQLNNTKEQLTYKIQKIQILEQLQAELTFQQKKLRQQLQNYQRIQQKLSDQKYTLQQSMSKAKLQNQVIKEQIMKLTLQNQNLRIQNEQLSEMAKIVDVKSYRLNDDHLTETFSSKVYAINQSQNQETLHVQQAQRAKQLIQSQNNQIKKLQEQNIEQSKQICSLQVQNKNLMAENESLYLQISQHKAKIVQLNQKIDSMPSSLNLQYSLSQQSNSKFAKKPHNTNQMFKHISHENENNQNNQLEEEQIQIRLTASHQQTEKNKTSFQSQRFSEEPKYCNRSQEEEQYQRDEYLTHTQPNPPHDSQKYGQARSSSSLKLSQSESNLSNQMEMKLMELEKLEAQILQLREQLDRKSHLQEQVQRLNSKVQELQELNKQISQRVLSPIEQQQDEKTQQNSIQNSCRNNQQAARSQQKLQTSLQSSRIGIQKLSNQVIVNTNIQSYPQFLKNANSIFEKIMSYIQNYQETPSRQLEKTQVNIEQLIQLSQKQLFKILAGDQSEVNIANVANVVNQQQSQVNGHLSSFQPASTQSSSMLQKMFNSIKYRLKILKKLESQKYLSMEQQQEQINKLQNKIQQYQSKVINMSQKINQSEAISLRYEEILMEMLHLQQSKKSIQEVNQKLRAKNTQLKTEVSQLINQIEMLSAQNSIQKKTQQQQNKVKQDKQILTDTINNKKIQIEDYQRLNEQNHQQRVQLQKSEYQLLKLQAVISKVENKLQGSNSSQVQNAETQNYLQFLKSIIQKIQTTQQNVQNIQLSMERLKQKIFITKQKHQTNVQQKDLSKEKLRIKNCQQKENSFNQLDNSLNNNSPNKSIDGLNKSVDSPSKMIQIQHLKQLQRKLTQNDQLMKKYKYSLQNDLSNLMKEILQAEQHETISRNKFQTYLQKIQSKIHSQFNPDYPKTYEQAHTNNQITRNKEISKQNDKQQKQNRSRFYTQNRPSTKVGHKNCEGLEKSPSSLQSSQKLKLDVPTLKQKIFLKLSIQMKKIQMEILAKIDQKTKSTFVSQSWFSYTPKYISNVILSIIQHISSKQSLKQIQSGVTFTLSSEVESQITKLFNHLKEINEQFESTVSQLGQIGKIIQANAERISSKYIHQSKVQESRQQHVYISINDIESEDNNSIYQESASNSRTVTKEQLHFQLPLSTIVNSQKLMSIPVPEGQWQTYTRSPFSIKQINQVEYRSNALTRRQSEHIVNQTDL